MEVTWSEDGLVGRDEDVEGDRWVERFRLDLNLDLVSSLETRFSMDRLSFGLGLRLFGL